MRRRSMLPGSRAVQAAVAGAMLAVPATALALAGDPSSQAGPGLLVKLSSHRVGYHRDLVVTGQAPTAEAGHAISLELLPTGSSSWRSIASSPVSSSGSFRLKVWLRRSGALRAVGQWTQPTSASRAVPATGRASQPREHDQASAVQPVWVKARLEVPGQSIDALGGQPVSIHGRLLPGQAGRRLALQELRAGRWYTVAEPRTSRHGEFAARYVPGGNTMRRLRVRFAGDRSNTAVSTGAGRVTVYQPSVASWYDDTGDTACGFHAYYGVANLNLPCGTKVNFYYHGRAITAVVQDRGPYGAGRQWDLNQNLAHALGFDGVDTVWTAR